jgi:hypothetical protein
MQLTRVMTSNFSLLASIMASILSWLVSFSQLPTTWASSLCMEAMGFSKSANLLESN